MWRCHICDHINDPEEHALFCEHCGQRRKPMKGYILRATGKGVSVWYTEDDKWSFTDENAMLFETADLASYSITLLGDEFDYELIWKDKS